MREVIMCLTPKEFDGDYHAEILQDLVRCRDCKHRYDDGYCEVWGDSFYHWEEFDEVPEDMFCGHGERREDETAD